MPSHSREGAFQLPGSPLTEADLAKLTASGIPRELAEQALLRRVTSPEGAAIVGRNGAGDCAGILFAYFWPGEDHIREYRLRRDRPEMEYDAQGKPRERNKYLSPPGRGNLLYFVSGTAPEWLADPSLPITITEGEKKALALWVLAWHGLSEAAETPRFLPVGLAGVWNWRGTIGKTAGPDGDRRDVKGPIPDLARLEWDGRHVFIVFDVNVRTNDSVRAARNQLAAELGHRGAEVRYIDLPEVEGVNGVDDLLGLWGPQEVLALFETPTTVARAREYPLTEIGNAERLVHRCGRDVRHCHTLGTWFVWDARRWARDETAEVERLAKRTIRALHEEALAIPNKERRDGWLKFAMRSDTDHGVRAMLSRAAAEEGIPVCVADLDPDPFLLNAINGTINLKTGELLAHRREHCITKLVPVRYDPAARCSRWMQFLAEVFQPHPDVPGFMQRAVGYSLTGDIREECLFLLYGTGRNGKGTLLRTVSAMLGDYACTADFSTFAGSRDDRGPRDDVASMRGRRFVVSQEAREGAPLAESLVKWLTGGDPVRARNLYERSVEWLPTHKIWLAVNHKPVIRGTDPGIWSRIKLIPFDVSFEGREDRTLKQALLEEMAGILAWAVQGCLRWLEEGLEFPESVQQATAEYRRESDQVGRFIDESCLVGEFASIKARGLYEAYRKWAEGTGERILTETAFGRRLRERGFAKEHGRAGRLYRGIGLRADGDGFGDGCDGFR